MTGEDLMLMRRRRGLSQAELAARAGITRTQISRLETGHAAIVPLRERQLREILAEVPEKPDPRQARSSA